jgi:protein gp37
MPDGSIAKCYAETIAEGVTKANYEDGFSHHYYRPHVLKTIASGKDPRLIFIDSMSDLFGHWVPKADVHAVLDALRKGPHHTYQSLTKAAPQILQHVDRLSPNLWVGVSSPPDWFNGNRLTRQQQIKMLRKSLDVLAKVKQRTGNIVWMSAEPVSWDLTEVIGPDHPLDWVVIGAATNGPKTFQPDPTHIDRLLDVFDQSKTPVFYKGNIASLFESHDFESKEKNRWREDFPLKYRDGKPIPAVAARQKKCRERGWTRIALPVI